MDVSLDFMALGCNRVAGCADWGKNGTFIYPGHRSIALYRPEDHKISQILNGHTKRVNCVKWLAADGNETEIASGSADFSIMIWSKVMLCNLYLG